MTIAAFQGSFESLTSYAAVVSYVLFLRVLQ
jgi:hypothetical protein